MIVCTLCSCYPWEVLGLPPVWYKSAPYRARSVNDPRGVLADFGVTLPADTQIRVWDSTAETRFIVLPMRPAGHRRLERRKTRDAGDARQHDRHRPAEKSRRGRVMDGIHDMGGMHGFGKVEPEPNEPVFHEKWEGRVFALTRAIGYTGVWPLDRSRSAQEKLPPDVYLSVSYYKRWELGLESNLAALGLAGADEIAAGHALRPGKPLARKLSAADVPSSLTRGSFARPASAPARFKPGDRVRTKNIHPATHTRLPRYARGRVGVIEARARLSCLSRYGRDRSRRKSAMALHGAVRRPRIMGRGDRSDAQSVDRGVRAVSGAGSSDAGRRRNAARDAGGAKHSAR